MLRLSYIVTGILFLGLAYFVLALLHVTAAFAWILFIAAACLLFWRRAQVERSLAGARLSAILTAAGAASAGIGARWLQGSTTAWEWVGIPLAAVLTWGLFALMAWSRGGTLCRICGRAAKAYDCPRCLRPTCSSANCWHPTLFRCRDCHQRGVALLPLEDYAWWDVQFGSPQQGRCQHCEKIDSELEYGNDLRPCRKCDWAMCRRCWDYTNGVCQRCRQWTVSDLPSALSPFAHYLPRSSPGLERVGPRR